jgi:hypothetical protein
MPKRRAEPASEPPKPEAPSKRKPEIVDTRDRAPAPVSLGQGVRKDPYARISFYDPANQAAADRLLMAGNDKGLREEESNEATIANIEEMLDGYEWNSVGTLGIWGESEGAADQIEARLLKELSALDAVSNQISDPRRGLSSSGQYVFVR